MAPPANRGPEDAAAHAPTESLPSEATPLGDVKDTADPADSDAARTAASRASGERQARRAPSEDEEHTTQFALAASGPAREATDQEPAEQAPDRPLQEGEEAETSRARPGPAAEATDAPQQNDDADSVSKAPPADGSSWVGSEPGGRYRILDLIGEGGMGVVYRAEHMRIHRPAAIKVIHPELARDQALMTRFEREALAAGQLDHPHIVAAIDFEQLADDQAYMVMPLLRGHSLQTEVEQDGPIEWRRVCRMGAQMADALSAAHGLGIIHRDLKPENVHVERQGDGTACLRVLDFGVASLSGNTGALAAAAHRPLTQEGTVLGTPGYMSPEQATAGAIDRRTDIYALGVILWEMAAGQRLFDGANLTEIVSQQIRGAIRAPISPRDPGTARFIALVRSMLSPDQNDRPDNAIEIRDQLRDLATSPDPEVVEQANSERARNFRQRQIQLAMVAAAVALAALLFFWNANEAPADPPPAPAASVQADTPRSKRPVKAAREKQASGRDAPRSLKEARNTLMHGRWKQARKAARFIESHEDAGKQPRHVRFAIELLTGQRCGQRRDTIHRIADAKDARLLPVLKRLSRRPRTGCGMLRLADCQQCLRKPLAETIKKLEK